MDNEKDNKIYSVGDIPMRTYRQHRTFFNILIIFALGMTFSLANLHSAPSNDEGPPKIFAGTLRDDAGNPVAGAKLLAKNVGGFYSGMVTEKSAEVTTDEEGRFSLQTAFVPVYLSIRTDVGTMTYPANPYYGRIPLQLLRQSEHNIVLMRWAKVSGNVVDDKTGEPIKEFHVHFRTSTSHTPQIYESDEGRFVNTRVTPGMLTITVMAKGYAPKVIYALAATPDSKNDVGDVRMAGGPTLRGRVLSASAGQPFRDMLIRFHNTRTNAVVNYPPGSLAATTDAEGCFTVANMPLLALELYTYIEKPERRYVTIGKVDMSLAREGVLDAQFFVEAEIEPLSTRRSDPNSPELPEQGAGPDIITIEANPKFQTKAVGSVADKEGRHLSYEMTWLVLNRDEQEIRVLWSTTTSRAPISLDKNETYIFEIKTKMFEGRPLHYIGKVKKDGEVLLENWMP